MYNRESSRVNHLPHLLLINLIAKQMTQHSLTFSRPLNAYGKRSKMRFYSNVVKAIKITETDVREIPKACSRAHSGLHLKPNQEKSNWREWRTIKTIMGAFEQFDFYEVLVSDFRARAFNFIDFLMKFAFLFFRRFVKIGENSSAMTIACGNLIDYCLNILEFKFSHKVYSH